MSERPPMTLPPRVSAENPDTDDHQELSRISVLIGRVLLDVGLPTRTSISAVVDDVIELARGRLPHGVELDVEEHGSRRWTFARPSGEVVDPDLSLAEANVYDGDLLMLHDYEAPASSWLVDHFEDSGRSAHRLVERSMRAARFTPAIVASIAGAIFVSRFAVQPSVAGIPIAPAAALLVGCGLAVTAWLASGLLGHAQVSGWLMGVALPLVFVGSLYVVPGVHGLQALPMALALTALAALIELLVGGGGRPVYTAICAVVVLGVPAAAAYSLLDVASRTVGAALATAAVIAVYRAPRVTISMSGLQIPRVPTAGEPLDDILMQGGTTVDGVNALGQQIVPTDVGLAHRVGRANDHLTGIVTAAAVTALAGCYLATDVLRGFDWQGTAFALAVATVLCLRGRSHHDLAQATCLIGGGMLTAIVVIAKTALFVEEWSVNAAIALVATSMLLVACGLIAPNMEISPVMRRRVELGEYLAIAMVLPLACWIVGIYGYFRELRL